MGGCPSPLCAFSGGKCASGGKDFRESGYCLPIDPFHRKVHPSILFSVYQKEELNYSILSFEAFTTIQVGKR